MKITQLFPSLLDAFVKTNNSNPSSTKKGPGRFHRNGHQKSRMKGVQMPATALAGILQQS